MPLDEGVYNASPPTPTSGVPLPLQLDSSGNLKVNIEAGSSGGAGVLPTGATYENANSNGTPITTATSAVLFAAVAGKRHYAWLWFSNSGSTTVGVQILDGSTVIFDGDAEASGGGGAIQFPVALRGSVNTAMSINVLASGGSIKYTVVGYNL